MNRGTGFSVQRSGLALVKKGVQRVEELAVVREGSTGRVVSITPAPLRTGPMMLPRVWAVADLASAPCKALPLGDDVDSEVGAHRAKPRPPVPELAFYRKYTEGMLRRYMRLSMACGRVPSLLGRELFRGDVTHYQVHGFDDSVIFCVDVEKCLAKLQPVERSLMKRIAVQKYSYAETAAIFGLCLRGCKQRYWEALDKLTGILLAARMLEPLKSCQGGTEVLIGVSRTAD